MAKAATGRGRGKTGAGSTTGSARAGAQRTTASGMPRALENRIIGDVRVTLRSAWDEHMKSTGGETTGARRGGKKAA